MISVEHLNDPELGTLHIRRNGHAVRIIFRPVPDGMLITVPRMASLASIRQALERSRAKLRELRQQFQERRMPISPQFRIDSPMFTFYFELSHTLTSLLELIATPQGLVCCYPQGHNFHSTRFQHWITAHIEDRMRQLALLQFEPRLQALAQQRGLHYTHLRITKARTRWGSCSTQRHICLSLYLITLPHHLQDYVMQHELTHLLEMNHSPRFHTLLNEALGGREQECLQELAQCRIPF